METKLVAVTLSSTWLWLSVSSVLCGYMWMFVTVQSNFVFMSHGPPKSYTHTHSIRYKQTLSLAFKNSPHRLHHHCMDLAYGLCFDKSEQKNKSIIIKYFWAPSAVFSFVQAG